MLINNSGASHYSFNSVQTHVSVINGKRQSTTEAVSVRNGKGMKTVVKRYGSKKTRSKKALSSSEIQNIKDRKFMPEFFVPCYEDCDRLLNKRKTRKSMKRVKKGSK
jgi:hypothetical protein